ncbi:DUF1761 domain-containing protein [Wenyingzhuangia sp. IMCC45574]
MEPNLLITLLAAIVPLVTGFIWYHKSVFGNAWMRTIGIDPNAEMTPPNPIIFLWCFLLSFLIAFILTPIVIHQYGVFSVLIDEPGFNKPGSEVATYFQDFMKQYGNNFRTFKHGALHGSLIGLLLITPILGIISLFEKKPFKYVAINGAYWAVSLAIMGGIICQFA